MPKNCAKCGAENVIQAAACDVCGKSFGRRPSTGPPKPKGNRLVGCLTLLLGLFLLLYVVSKFVR